MYLTSKYDGLHGEDDVVAEVEATLKEVSVSKPKLSGRPAEGRELGGDLEGVDADLSLVV